MALSWTRICWFRAQNETVVSIIAFLSLSSLVQLPAMDTNIEHFIEFLNSQRRSENVRDRHPCQSLNSPYLNSIVMVSWFCEAIQYEADVPTLVASAALMVITHEYSVLLWRPSRQLYDFSLTLHLEIKLIWLQPFSYTKVLFLLSRYVPMVYVSLLLYSECITTSLVLQTYLPKPSYLPLSPDRRALWCLLQLHVSLLSEVAL